MLFLGVESRSIYEEADQIFEKRSKIFKTMQSYVFIPLYMFPNVIISYYRYFTAEKSNETFLLLMPAT